MMIRYLLFVAGVFFQFSSWACELTSDSSWFWSEDELVKRTRYIFLVKVTEEVEGSKSGLSTFKATIEKVLKAPLGAKLASEIKLQDFAPSKTEMKLDRRKGRSIYTKDCRPWTYFQLQREYIVFLNDMAPNSEKVLHARAYEDFSGDTDPWYQKVLKLTGASISNEVTVTDRYLCKLDKDCQLVNSHMSPGKNGPSGTLVSCVASTASLKEGAEWPATVGTASSCICKNGRCALK
jgi:hypothetical protein